MKKYIAYSLVLSFLLIIIMGGCTDVNKQLKKSLSSYSKAVEGLLPEDVFMTIYYIDPSILTYAPVSAEDLTTFSGVQKIVVGNAELKSHQEMLKKLNASILQPVKEETYINARLYYVVETGDSSKLLEVVISQINGSVFVNGIAVEDNPVFFELIAPFLTEDFTNKWGDIESLTSAKA